MAYGLVLSESPTTSFTGLTTLHWMVIILRGEVVNRTMQIITSIVAVCSEEVVQESGTTYGAP